MGEHNYGPSPMASVVMNLGGDIGALIIEAGAGQLGAEIEISPAGGGVRTHSMVRERLTVPDPRYDAVYPDLTAGRYTIWRDAQTPAATVTVHGGQITHHAWAQ